MGNAKAHLYNSQLHIDHQNLNRTTRRVVCKSDNVADDPQAMAEAIADCIGEVGGSLDGLPLKTSDAQRDKFRGPNSARVVLNYGHNLGGGSEQAVKTTVRLSGGTIALPWYNRVTAKAEWTTAVDTGQPDGDFLFKSLRRETAIDTNSLQEDPPVPWIRIAKAYAVFVRGQGETSPFANIDGLFGMTNSDSVIFYGKLFTPNQLLFSQPDITEFEVANGNFYTWDYVFVWVPVTFQKQEVYWDNATSKWVLETVDLHNQGTFTGNFPTAT